MSLKSSRHLSRSVNPQRSVWLGTGVAAVAASAGLLAAAAPAAAQTPSQTSLLNQGSAGSAVSRVQRALHLQATGRFGRATERAVLAFQRRDRLSVDGVVGPQTWDALFRITPHGSASSSTTGASAASSTGGYSIPSGIVQCESGGNYSAVNPSSGAGGAYQILPSTWSAYGGQGSPQDAPKAEQDRIAAEIYARQGASAWVC
jgi:peptidoglycan hydrolase-like protein with peptidoglycan-binding domain